jgi:hypothetical protein
VNARAAPRVAQAWVRLRADDPAAVSALMVARRSLAAGPTLASLRRFRLFELNGPLPVREELAELLHRSSQFYNPHKEECRVRANAAEPAPVEADEQVVLVFDRGLVRRTAAERWWSQVTGGPVEVREGVVWALRFKPGMAAAAQAADLAVLRDQAHGLLCNPHAQEHRLAGAEVPLPWLTPAPARARRRVS